MQPIRVLVVDDSAVTRRALSLGLGNESGIEVVATAASGKIAIAKLERAVPDVVTLDIAMPEMNGIETLREIRARYPKLPVIMFSSACEAGAAATVEALALGASDYVLKPSTLCGSDGNLATTLKALARRIRNLAQQSNSSHSAGGLSQIGEPSHPPEANEVEWKIPGSAADYGGVRARPTVVVIGVSTGGPNALQQVIPLLPADFPVPVLVVQHMPPIFTRQLAERLNQTSPLNVSEGRSSERVLPGNVWIAPGDYHMVLKGTIARCVLELNQNPPEHSCRPAVDPLFRSAAKTHGAGVLGVVLTGMGADGTAGAAEIAAAGGRILIQDEATSTVWGMPGSIAKSGVPHTVLPLDEIAGAIIRATSISSRSPAKPARV